MDIGKILRVLLLFLPLLAALQLNAEAAANPDDSTATEREIRKPPAGTVEIPEIGPDNFWIFYQRALKSATGKRSFSIPLPGASAASKLELVVDDDLKRYIAYDQTGMLWKQESDDIVASSEKEIKALISGICGYDELRMPMEKPRFIIRVMENELCISDLGIASNGLLGAGKKIENVEFVASPLLPSGIKEFIIDGKSYSTSFNGKEFRDPDARIIYFFSGSNYDFFIRYKFTFSDKMAGLDDTAKCSYMLEDKTGSLNSKLASASAKDILIKCQSSQFKCLEMIKPYLVELKDDLEKVKLKILQEADGIDGVAEKLDNPPAFKAYMIQQKSSRGNAIAAKKKELEKLQSSNYQASPTQPRRRSLDKAMEKDLSGNSMDSFERQDDNSRKIRQLENEIYKLQNSLVKFSDQYFMDLVDEYDSKSTLLKTEPLKRLKEEGRTEEFESILSGDLNGAEFVIMSKKDGMKLKKLKITKVK